MLGLDTKKMYMRREDSFNNFKRTNFRVHTFMRDQLFQMKELALLCKKSPPSQFSNQMIKMRIWVCIRRRALKLAAKYKLKMR